MDPVNFNTDPLKQDLLAQLFRKIMTDDKTPPPPPEEKKKTPNK